MPVNGVCQRCGTILPLEMFLTDAIYRECLVLMVKLPQELAVVIPYLSLFRPASGQAVAAKKLRRLLSELADLVALGHVQVQGKPARPCPPRIWAAAMEQMSERRDKLNLPMPNHKYLRDVAWTLADQADAGAERDRNQQERSGNLRSYNDDQTARPVSWSAIDRLMQQGESTNG